MLEGFCNRLFVKRIKLTVKNDCAVAVQYRWKGIGRMIMETILSKLQDCNVILYASLGKESFYEKFAFRKMKTGMAKFTKSESCKNLASQSRYCRIEGK
jgi:predicted N-acetyltransferase YhbS